MNAARTLTRIAWAGGRGLVLWLLIALAFWALAAVMPGIDVPSFRATLLSTALIALLNALLWPVLIRLILPLTGPRRTSSARSWSASSSRSA
jgi:hypothetical protein